jgi:hypothetical protein
LKVRAQKRSAGSTDLANRVRAIIEHTGLSLHDVSQATEAMFGRNSPQFLPHNFYYELNLGSFSPSLHQLFALSRISNYRMFDWLHVFGLNVEYIPRLQILLPTKRTILLESSLNDPDASVPWFRNKLNEGMLPSVAPLSQLQQALGKVRCWNGIARIPFTQRLGRRTLLLFRICFLAASCGLLRQPRMQFMLSDLTACFSLNTLEESAAVAFWLQPDEKSHSLARNCHMLRFL